VKCGAAITDPGSAEAMGLLGELSRALEGRYSIGDVIGAGRGGITTVATQIPSKRQVAIKVAWNEAHARTQVLRETVLTGKVQHPRVMPMRDIQAPESMLVVEMPLATGGTVADLLVEERPVPYKRVLEIVRGVAGALDQAHAAGIIHGGLRPIKILLDGEGQPLLTDFEIRVPRRADWDVSRPSEVGAQAYMPLEQRHDSPSIDGRVDQYALAIIAYELLRGQPTWRINHEGVLEIDALDILVHRPIAPDVPLSASTAIKRATAKDPTFRYSSVNAFLQAFAGEANEVAGVEHIYRDQTVVKPQRSLMWLSVPATLAILLLAMQPTVRTSAVDYWDRNWGTGKKARVADPDLPTAGSGGNLRTTLGSSSPSSAPQPQNQAPNNTVVGAGTAAGGTGGTVRTSSAPPPLPNTAPPRQFAVIDPSATRRPDSNSKAGSSGGSSRSGGSSLPRPGVVGGDVSKSGTDTVTDTRPGYIVVSLNADSRAAVIVDGRPRGLTPLTISVPAGKHTVKLGGTGTATYTPASAAINVGPGDTVRTSCALGRRP
jgi:serine/threonine-protein kinase